MNWKIREKGVSFFSKLLVVNTTNCCYSETITGMDPRFFQEGVQMYKIKAHFITTKIGRLI